MKGGICCFRGWVGDRFWELRHGYITVVQFRVKGLPVFAILSFKRKKKRNVRMGPISWGQLGIDNIGTGLEQNGTRSRYIWDCS